MSVQDDKEAGQESGQQTTEKPEPGEEQKEKAAEMMTAYQDRATLVLPGTGGMVSGTAVNDWLDDDGNPKGADDDQDDQDRGENAEAKAENADDKNENAQGTKEQIDKDKAFNEELRKASAEDNKGEKG